jgi:hypothetical protein
MYIKHLSAGSMLERCTSVRVPISPLGCLLSRPATHVQAGGPTRNSTMIEKRWLRSSIGNLPLFGFPATTDPALKLGRVFEEDSTLIPLPKCQIRVVSHATKPRTTRHKRIKKRHGADSLLYGAHWQTEKPLAATIRGALFHTIQRSSQLVLSDPLYFLYKG